MTEMNDGSEVAFGQIDVQPSPNWPPKWIKRLPKVYRQRQFSELCYVWGSAGDGWLFTYADDCSSSTKAGNCTPVPQLNIHWVETGYFFRWITFYAPSGWWTLAHLAWNVRKQTPCNNCQKFPSWMWQRSGLGNIFVAFPMDALFIMECPVDQRKYVSISVLTNYAHPYMRIVFFLSTTASTGRTIQRVIKLAAY